jgi:hypothetical protein
MTSARPCQASRGHSITVTGDGAGGEAGLESKVEFTSAGLLF